MASERETEAPESLLEAINHFAYETTAIEYVAALRWPEGEQHCPHCGSAASHYWLAPRKSWKCRDCRKVFSIKVGTIFEGSPISLSKWLPAMWMLANCKNGISSYELASALRVTQKTAWFMLHRIRLAMQNGTIDKMKGEVEVDEIYIGGAARFMHADKRKRVVKNMRGGTAGKIAVMGLLERHGPDGSQVRTHLPESIKRSQLIPEVIANVEPGSSVYSDNLSSYTGLNHRYTHKVINHAECYAKGQVHTNGIENFWSLFKRAVKGTYVSVEPFHLFRYLDEQTFRFNNRKASARDRFERLLDAILGKHLTYDHLIGADRRQYA